MPNTLHGHYDSEPSMPFHGILSNQNTHVPYSSQGKTLCATTLLIISNDRDLHLENRWTQVSVTCSSSSYQPGSSSSFVIAFEDPDGETLKHLLTD